MIQADAGQVQRRRRYNDPDHVWHPEDGTYRDRREVTAIGDEEASVLTNG